MSTERIILGNNCIFSGNPRETGLNRNVLVVGELVAEKQYRLLNRLLWRH